MADDHGQSVIAACDGEDARVDGHLAAGETERVDHVVVIDQDNLPGEAVRDLRVYLDGCSDHSAGDPLDLLIRGA